MIICPNCSRENEDHYKFCLGCGTEISKARPAAPPQIFPQAAPAPTALPQATPLARAVPVQVAPPEASRALLRPAASPIPEPFDDVPEVVPQPARVVTIEPPAPRSASTIELPFDLSVDDGSAFGGPTTAPPPVAAPEPESEQPGGSLLGMPPPARVSRPVTARPEAMDRACGSCGAAVPEGFKFCGVCGTRYEAEPASSLPQPVVMDAAVAPARLVLIHPDGTEGDTFPLNAGETVVGRTHPTPLFAEDPFLSPRHATFYFVKGQLFVRDEASLNGVFLRIKAEVELFHWDMFRIGQQLMRFEEMSQVRPVTPGAGDGTTVMGSPVRGAWGRLGMMVGIDTVASVWTLRAPEAYMGRERGDILFPEDGFVSGSHAKVVTRDGRYFLADLGSTNGTYLRIKGEGIVAQGDLLLLGQQLFKVEIG